MGKSINLEKFVIAIPSSRDNTFLTECIESLKKVFKGIPIYIYKNKGSNFGLESYGAIRNKILLDHMGKYIVFIDDDIIVDKPRVYTGNIKTEQKSLFFYVNNDDDIEQYSKPVDITSLYNCFIKNIDENCLMISTSVYGKTTNKTQNYYVIKSMYETLKFFNFSDEYYKSINTKNNRIFLVFKKNYWRGIISYTPASLFLLNSNNILPPFFPIDRGELGSYRTLYNTFYGDKCFNENYAVSVYHKGENLKERDTSFFDNRTYIVKIFIQIIRSLYFNTYQKIGQYIYNLFSSDYEYLKNMIHSYIKKMEYHKLNSLYPILDETPPCLFKEDLYTYIKRTEKLVENIDEYMYYAITRHTNITFEKMIQIFRNYGNLLMNWEKIWEKNSKKKQKTGYEIIE